MAPLFPTINPDAGRRTLEWLTESAFWIACQDPGVLAQYPRCAQLFERHQQRLEVHAREPAPGPPDDKGHGLATKWPLIAWVEVVHNTRLLPRMDGLKVRRHLALAVFELLLEQPHGISHKQIGRLASDQRRLLENLHEKKRAMDGRIQPATRQVLVQELSDLPQGDRTFGSRFWAFWRSRFAKWLLHPSEPRAAAEGWGLAGVESEEAKAEKAELGNLDADDPLFDSDDDDADDERSGLDDTAPAIDWRLAPEDGTRAPDDFGVEPTEAGPRLRGEPAGRPRHAAASRSHLSRYSPASPLYLHEEEVRDFWRLGVGKAREAVNPESEQVALAHLLALTTGSHPNALSELRWGEPGDETTFPGLLTPDCAWLVRPPLIVEDAAGRKTGYGQAWLPVDPEIRGLLADMKTRTGSVAEIDEPLRGLRVFPELDPRKPVPSLARDTAAIPARVRMALLCRLVESEPYSVQAAQLAAGATLGSSVAALHYEDICPVEFASVVEREVARMLGRKPRNGFATSFGPTARLGLGWRRRVDDDEVRAAYDALASARARSLEEAAVALSRNLVAGIEAASGCRPGRIEASAERADFCFQTGVLVVCDKATEPEAIFRPVPLPPALEPDFNALLTVLNRCTEEARDEAFRNAARSACESRGPIFFATGLGTGDSQWRSAPVSVEDGHSVVRNFARHRLNLAAVEAGMPYLERCAILGRAVARKTVLGDCACEPAANLMARQREFQGRHLAREGWRPWRSSADFACAVETAEASVPDFLRCERRLDEALSDLWKRAAERLKEREDAFRTQHAPTLARAMRLEFPGVRVTDDLQFAAAPELGSPAPSPAAESFERLVQAVSTATLCTREGVHAHRLVSQALKDAAKAGALDLLQHREVSAEVRRKRGWFGPGQPGAFRALLDLRKTLSEEATPPSHERVALAVMLYSAPLPVGDLVALLHPQTQFAWIDERPGVVYASWTESEGGDEPGSCGRAGRQRVKAFNGMAAVHLARYSRTRDAMDTAPTTRGELALAIHDALPKHFRCEDPARTLENLQAMIRLASALGQEGPARLASLGGAQVSTESLDRILACHAGVLLDSDPAPARPKPGSSGRSRREGTLKRLARILPTNPSTTEAKLKEEITSLAQELAEEPLCAETVLVRYAKSLLEHGGKKKSKLEATTVHGYVIPMAGDFVKAFTGDVAALDGAGWLDCVHSYLDAADLQVRRLRLEQLEYLHWRMRDELDFPYVDFDTVLALLPKRDEGARPGVVSAREIGQAMTYLVHHRNLLNEGMASAQALYGQASSELALLAQAAMGPRSAEVMGLTFRDVVVGDDACFARVRRTRYGRIKTGNARRCIEPRPEFRDAFREAFLSRLRSAQERYRSDFHPGLPLFGEWQEEGALDRTSVFEPVSEALRWAVDGRARPYSLRKGWAQHALEERGRGTPGTMRLANRIQMLGHGSIKVTVENYLHDPAQLLSRITLPGIDELASAAGVSPRTVRRARAAVDGESPDKIVSALLGRCSYKLPTAVPERPLPERSEVPAAGLEVEHVERVLRTLDRRGRDVLDAAAPWNIPSPMIEALDAALGLLARDYRLGFGRSTGVRRVKSSRQTETFEQIREWTRAPASRDVLLEMAKAFAFQSRRSGLDSLEVHAAQWESWTARHPALTTLPWLTQTHGTFMTLALGSQQGAKINCWPAFRWWMLMTWVWDQATGGQSV